MTTTQAVSGSVEEQIRQTLDGYIAAIKRKDIDEIMSFYATDVVAFDLMPPLSYAGRDAYRKSWEQGLSMMQGDIDYEVKDVKISVAGDVGFCHFLNRMGMTSSDGQRMDFWSRLTWGLRKQQGRWLIAHEHGSFPIDMESSKALTELKP